MAGIASIAPSSAAVAASASTALSSGSSRLLVVAVACVGVAAGLLATDGSLAAHAVSQAGPDLTRLMRAMAALKAMMAVAVTAAVFWRLGSTIIWGWLVAYAAAIAAMAFGPGLIWDMAHIVIGSVLLHAGLVAAVVLLWRDPVVGNRLALLVEAKRTALRSR